MIQIDEVVYAKIMSDFKEIQEYLADAEGAERAWALAGDVEAALEQAARPTKGFSLREHLAIPVEPEAPGLIGRLTRAIWQEG